MKKAPRRSLPALLCLGIGLMLTERTEASGQPPRLSRERVIAIADAQARTVLKADSAHFHRTTVTYFAKEHLWSVGFEHKKTPSNAFFVMVNDLTREAAMVRE